MSEELSYVHSPKQDEFLYKTIIDLLREDVSATPHSECMIYRWTDGSRKSLTYQELLTKATQLAKLLVTKGIKKGDKMALLGPNTLEKAVAEFGIIIAGGVVVNLTISLRDGQDVLNTFNNAGCRFLLVDPGRDLTYHKSILQLIDTFHRNRSKDETEAFGNQLFLLRSVDDIPTCFDLSKMSDENMEAKCPVLYPEEEFIIFYTSGSTDKSKLVSHSHFNLINSGGLIPQHPDQKKKIYNDRPFGWMTGSPSIIYCKNQVRVFTDSTIAALSGKNTMAIWDIIKEENCTDALLMPYFIFDLSQLKHQYDRSFMLDTIATGGENIDSLCMQVVGVFTTALVIGYGSVEVLYATVTHPLGKEDHFIPGMAGSPVKGVEVKIVDENGKILERCQQGEICIRSPVMFKRYCNDAELKARSCLPGNWFRMGDIGYIRKDGRIVIQGRIKNVISRGINKIIPATLENVIIKMKGIANVVVVAVPDKRLYEEVCVCFTVMKDSKMTETNVKEFCDEEFQDSADGFGERPKYYVKFEYFPLLFNGKTDKRKIRSEAIERLRIDY